jgi:hypothetical protein
MDDNELNQILKRAATATPAVLPSSLGGQIMARVRVDDGRARRWRSFVQWLLILGFIAGVLTAAIIGWSLASRDRTHAVPPSMGLFREGLAQ